MEETLQYLDPDQYFSPQPSLRVFHHPNLKTQAEELQKAIRELNLKNHFAIFSSGTSSGALKGYIHSREALEANALAVNSFYNLTSSDTWALSLPDYHIGGLQVLLRAKLANAKVVDARGWEPRKWSSTLNDAAVRVTSIVPTQLYDLVRLEISPPSELRLLIVGGDFLSEELEKRARELGWPVIRTFGMTEAASQIASASIHENKLRVLPLHVLKVNEDRILKIKSVSLFSYQFKQNLGWVINPVSDLLDSEGYFKTSDEVELVDGVLTPLGRAGDYFKTGGHLMRLSQLREAVDKILIDHSQLGKAEIYIADDERKGKEVILQHEEISPELIELIKFSVLPARIDKILSVKRIQRTELGKAVTI